MLTVESRRAQFRRLIDGSQLVICPGVVNALTARVAEAAGFELIYATGAGIANAHLGVPDVGLLTMMEVLETDRRIAQSVSIPVLADIDSGYGGTFNVYRTVREFEAAEGGRTPNLPPVELSALGYRIALYTNTVLRAATAASATALEVLRRTGETKELMGSILSWEDRQNLVGLDEWLELGNSIADAEEIIGSD